jgi:23S rRNA (adenine2503-C2)-methyltransferase
VNEIAKEEKGFPLSNIVFMGMGEPLLNYRSVRTAIEHLTDQKYGMGMAPRRITVSTAGIAKMIRKMGDEEVKFNLALSLHAANDTKRSSIMPINDSNDLASLTEALLYFIKQTGRHVTFEYAVIAGVNDSFDEADELIRYVRNIPSKVNLIEYNPIDLADYKGSGMDTVEAFAKRLHQNGVKVMLRRSRGKDIDAACGQLANKL